MKGIVHFSGCTSKEFNIKSGVKQGCVLAPLFGILFALLLIHAFGTTSVGVYLHSRSDGRLFNLSRLKAKTKVREVTIREFADDAAVVSHTEQGLQTLMDLFSHSRKEFALTISLKKTNIMIVSRYQLNTICHNKWLWVGSSYKV